MKRPYWIDPSDEGMPFPDPELALRDPDGLLAIGGSLSPRRLIDAYSNGIFPWYSADQPILWWTPDPRLILFPEDLKISRSLRKTLRRPVYEITFDRAFSAVIDNCAQPRPNQDGTWITSEMRRAYCRLFELGYAHSAEAWFEGELVGGLYGIAIGRAFFGESMFARRTDASKAAFAHLVRQLERWDFEIIDCQVKSAHLESLGAIEMPRREFTRLVRTLTDAPGQIGPWQAEAIDF